MHTILEIYNKINRFGEDHEMTFEVIKPGEILYRMTVLERHLATHEVIHGGMLAAFMDAIMGVAALSKAAENNNLVSTVEFKINYLSPVHINQQLLGKGTLDREGKTIYIASGEIRDENTDELLAKGMGTFKAYPIEKTGLHEKYDIS